MEKTILSKVVTGSLPYSNVTAGSTILIGEASKGPMEVPIKGDSVENVAKIFGWESQLTNAFIEFRGVSDAEVFLIKSNGNTARAVLTDIELNPRLKFVTVDANYDANFRMVRTYTVQDSETLAESTYLEIADFIAGTTKRYLMDGKTISELESMINRDAYAGIINVFAQTVINGDSSEIMDQRVDFQDGADTISESRLFDIFNDLMDIQVSQIGILGETFLDPIPGNSWWYYHVASYADKRVEAGMPCLFNVGHEVNRPSETLYEILHKFATEDLDKLTISEYINFVVAKVDIANTHSDYTSNGVASYSGLVANLSVGESTTGKRVPGIKNSYTVFNDDEIKALNEFGYAVMLFGRRTGARIMSGSNLLRGTDGYTYVYMEVLSETGVTTYEKVMIKKPQAASKISNVMVAMDFTTRIYNKLNHEIGGFSTEQDDIVEPIARILQEYDGIIKESTVKITDTAIGFTKTFLVEAEILIYGEIESIGISVSVW